MLVAILKLLKSLSEILCNRNIAETRKVTETICLLGSIVVRASDSRSGGCGFKPHPGQYFWLVVNCATIKTYTHSAISKCKNTCLLSKQHQLKLETEEKSKYKKKKYLKHLCNRHNLPQTIVYLITSLGAGTIIYNDQTVRDVISDVDVYSAPCRFLVITEKILIVS